MVKNARGLDVEMIEAEENLVIDVQFFLTELMCRQSVSKSDLAKRLGLSKARLSQMFAADANPTLRSVARIIHALGSAASLTEKQDDHQYGHGFGEMDYEFVSGGGRKAKNRKASEECTIVKLDAFLRERQQEDIDSGGNGVAKNAVSC